MNRKKFFKTTCGLGIGSCAGFGVLSNGNLFASAIQDTNETIKTPVIPVDARQIQNLLCYIDSSMDESTKQKIFEKLGYEHTTKDSFIKWINGYKNNLKSFFDDINNHTNPESDWEKIKYDPELSEIKITGKPADRCACPYAQEANPPKSLCNYCCTSFQKIMFEMLLEKPVKVQLDETFLLGGKRCNVTIFVEGKLPIEKI